MRNFILYFLIIALICIKEYACSLGDSARVFNLCLRKCNYEKCSGKEPFVGQPIHLRLLKWTCWDECDYDCMWKSVKLYEMKGKPVPQFHGKWPFIRLFGVQEPASVLFSIWNFYANFSGILRLRRKVRQDSPMYYVWHAFCLISLNAWIWSTIFHARDFPMTEFMDYASAFSIVLCSSYCMLIRVLKEFPAFPRFLKVILTVFFVGFYYDHIVYLKVGVFDYKYNMQVNMLVGSMTLFAWLLWAYCKRKQQPYVWKIALFATLCAATLTLEVIDRPPLFYVLDSHALWHFTSVPITYLLYSFIIDDCQYLRKQYLLEMKNDAKDVVDKLKQP